MLIRAFCAGMLLVSSCDGAPRGAGPTAEAHAPTPAASRAKRPAGSQTMKEDRYADEREAMVLEQIEGRGITAPRVREAMRKVPRHRFVAERFAHEAYTDQPLPIEAGQTISQPYIVALMTQTLGLPAWREAHTGQQPKVLDVGTGSGYQAAVLAEMGAQVVSIEREESLADEARDRLESLGYQVTVVVGDGSGGAPSEAPFAAIVVAAAAPAVPQPLVDQLLPDGRLVIPIGGRWEQEIVLVRPTAGGFTRDLVEQAVFVPLLGEHGFAER